MISNAVKCKIMWLHMGVKKVLYVLYCKLRYFGHGLTKKAIICTNHVHMEVKSSTTKICQLSMSPTNRSTYKYLYDLTCSTITHKPNQNHRLGTIVPLSFGQMS